MRAKTLIGIFAIVVVVTLGSGFSLVLAASYLNQPPAGPSDRDGNFMIHKGEALSSIARRLDSEGIIRSALWLRLLSRIRGTENAFKTGFYQIGGGVTTDAVHDLLVEGEQTLVSITIPEGWTISKIATLLESNNISSADEFENLAQSASMVNELLIPGDSVEGYLFPDTYLFPAGYPAADVIRTMTARFFAVLKEVYPDYESWKRKNLHKEIVLASVVEREYRIADEAPYIASVFKNRLKLNIGLESCATVEYIITEIQGKPHPEYITHKDLRIDSLYNTYKWHGLPPGPISNPGRVALDATFNSAVTDYYYFVLRDPTIGEHYFSSDLGEHNQAKYFYLKGK